MAARESLALEALSRDPGGAGLILDFDGVLSPIVENPAASRILDGTSEVLAQVARHVQCVAVLSGRQLDFLVERVSIPGVDLLGSYGVETMRHGVREIPPNVHPWLDTVQLSTTSLEKTFAGTPGIFVEHKTFSVAVHWRLAADRRAAQRAVHAAVSEVAASTGLHQEPGKFVEELRPPLSIDKGSAVAGLISEKGLSAIAYAGDDVGDIPAFQAVHNADGHALLVDHGSETDERLRSLSTEAFDGVQEFATWLRRLAARLEEDAVLPR